MLFDSGEDCVDFGFFGEEGDGEADEACICCAQTFVGKGGARDEALTQRMADEFLTLLQEEGIAGMEIDTKRSNGVNMAFAKCYAGWQKQHLVPSLPNGSACYRFLAEDCALCIKGAPKAYAEFIRKEIARRRC